MVKYGTLKGYDGAILSWWGMYCKDFAGVTDLSTSSISLSTLQMELGDLSHF